MEDSAYLVSRVNEYLDSAKELSETALVETRLQELSNLKETMIAAGFNATFPEMLMAVPKSDLDPEARSDLSNQLKKLRESANMKRYTYNRMRVALASHRILFNMLRRGKVYDVAKHIPYDGAYLTRLVYLGEPAVQAYGYLMKIFSDSQQEPGYLATIMHEGKLISLNLHSEKNLDEKIKKTYGDDAYLVSLKKVVAPPLVRFKSVRVAIASAYAIQAANRIYPEIESKSKLHSKEHEAYAAEISKFGISKDARIDMMEGHEALKDELYSKGLMVYENESLTLLPEIVSSISKRKSSYGSAVIREADKQFSNDVFHFFMVEPKRVRSSLPLYPGISMTFDPNTFTFIKNVTEIDDPVGVVQEKLKLETFSKVGRALGPALIYLSTKRLDWCAKEFDVDKEEITKAADQILLYKSSVSDQARRFMEGLNPKKKE